MARVTIDDCIKLIPNRFQLTLAATYRTRQLTLGSTPKIEAERDIPTVKALREIATGKISLRTVPRNFPGRSGTKEDQGYLCSPETAAASALTGACPAKPNSSNVSGGPGRPSRGPCAR